MRKFPIFFQMTPVIYSFLFSAIILSCNTSTTEPGKKENTEDKKMSETDMIKRGDYLVTVAGCNDCHSPKIFSGQSMKFDSSRLLSGHPAGSPLPKIDKNSLKPGNWILMYPDITGFVGPWGMSFPINLTPDTATGIGNWSESQFIKALRTGKHMGLDEGRPIMPPMPWEGFSHMTDEDLKAVFAYLKSLPAVNNRAPDYMPPPEVEKIAQ